MNGSDTCAFKITFVTKVSVRDVVYISNVLLLSLITLPGQLNPSGSNVTVRLKQSFLAENTTQ